MLIVVCESRWLTATPPHARYNCAHRSRSDIGSPNLRARLFAVGWGGACNVAALDGLGLPERARRTLAVLTMKWGPGDACDRMMGEGWAAHDTGIAWGVKSGTAAQMLSAGKCGWGRVGRELGVGWVGVGAGVGAGGVVAGLGWVVPAGCLGGPPHPTPLLSGSPLVPPPPPALLYCLQVTWVQAASALARTPRNFSSTTLPFALARAGPMVLLGG